MAEMLRRMSFEADAAKLERVWRGLYDPRRFNRLPQQLLGSAGKIVPQVVDETAFQTRRNLAHRALADVIRFRHEDEASIKEGARRLAEGSMPDTALPPRHLVSAASYALGTGRIHPPVLAGRVVARLAKEHPPAPPSLRAAQTALAA